MSSPGSASSSRRVNRFSFLFVLATIVSGISEAPAADETLKKVEAAWAARQKRVESAKFEWKQVVHELQPGGGRFGPMGGKAAKGKAEWAKIEESLSVRLSGDRFDFRLDTKDAAKFSKPSGMRASFDGSVSQNYSGTRRLPGEVGSGILTKTPYAFRTKRVHIFPITLTYRPMNDGISAISLKDFRVVPGTAVIGGDTCIRLQETKTVGEVRSLWVVPKRDYVIRRWGASVDGKPVLDVTISYRHNEVDGWIPSEWKVTHVNSKGELQQSATCTLAHFSINKPIPLSEFQIDFPPGTHVEDRVNGRNYIVPDVRASASVFGRRWLWFGSLGVVIVAILVVCVRIAPCISSEFCGSVSTSLLLTDMFRLHGQKRKENQMFQRLCLIVAVLISGTAAFELSQSLFAQCATGCLEGNCWKIADQCWKVDSTTCRWETESFYGDPARGAIGGTHVNTTPINWHKITGCSKECTQVDSRALNQYGTTTCNGTETGTWTYCKCYCAPAATGGGIP